MAETELGNMDAEWDYNCPQYVDFSEPLPLDDSADKWFDADHEDFEDSSIRISSEYQNGVQNPTEENVKTPTPQAQVAPMKSEGSAGPVTRQQAKMIPPSNIITSLDEWRAKKPQTESQSKPSSKKVGVVAPLRPGKRTNSSSDVSGLKSTDVSPVTSTNDSQRPALKRQRISGSNIRRSGSQSKLEVSSKRSLKRSNSTASSSKPERIAHPHTRGYSAGRPASQNREDTEVSSKRSLKRSNSSVSSSKPERIARPHTRGYSAGRPACQNKEDTDAPCAKMPKMATLPCTPTFMRRKQLAAGSPRVKTTEEQELEQIAHMRKELAKKRKMAKDSLKKSKNAPGYVPVCNSREPTMIQDFKFSTDSRLKSQPQDVQDESTIDFVKCLRSNTASTSQQGPRGATKVQPFKLTASHKPAPQTEKFQSMAQSVAAFHRSTPDRFRRKPRATSSDRKLLKARSPLRLTNPETPKLETRRRYRAPTAPSQKDIEDQEYEEIMKYQFKANPVNTKILSQVTGLYKPEPKPATKPEEFNLHSDRRFQERPNKAADEEEFVFHAQPVPRKILEGTVGVKAAKEIPNTVPQSPAFALKHRVRLPVEIPQEKEMEKPLPKAHAVPHPGIPFQPKLSHRTTTPEPFSFESRYPDPNSVKEAKLRQKLEEEQRAREFRANPLPRLEPVLPERHTKLCTKMEPFNLQSEIRGAKKSEEWNHKVLEEEQLKQKQAAMFKARPADVVRQEPFMPQRSSRPLTDVSELTLNTERRAVDRDEYEMRKKAREAQLAELNHEREAQKLEEEKAAIAKLRAEMVHKSNPIRKFKQVVVQGSEKPPTCPESPRFSDRLRGKVRV